MTGGTTPSEFAALLRKAQKAFWESAHGVPAFDTPDAFAQPDWQVFDSLVQRLLNGAGQGETWGALHRAAAAYRDVIAGTWTRIQTAFETHRRAIQDPSSPPDWRVLRDRWFDIAEAEFIRTLRSSAFVTAQRDLIREAAAAWPSLPEKTKIAARTSRAVASTAFETLKALDLDGVKIAQTPKHTVWQQGKTTLSRYEPLASPGPALGPVLICHGLIGRQTMTDLRPDRSMVRHLLAAGIDVFTLDWGNAGPEDADLGMEHYTGAVLPEVCRQVLAAAGTEKLVLFGVCQGGTMAACHAARDVGDLSGLILGVAPIDFHADRHDADPAHGLLHLWLRSLEDADIEALVGMERNLPGELIGLIFNQLNPIRTLAKYAIELPESAFDPSALTVFLAMEKWLADRPDLPGAMARTWLKEFYRENALVSGTFLLNGAAVDLSQIDVPVLNIFAMGDHIIPPPCSRALGAHLDPALYDELALPTGHVGAFVSARAQTLLAPRIVEWLPRCR